MGYRSTLISQDYGGELPKWFLEEYKDDIFSSSGCLIVSSKREVKQYGNSFFEDYQKAVLESGFWNGNDLSIVLAVLAEDGFITKVTIKKDDIIYTYMEEWMSGDRDWETKNINYYLIFKKWVKDSTIWSYTQDS